MANLEDRDLPGDKERSDQGGSDDGDFDLSGFTDGADASGAAPKPPARPKAGSDRPGPKGAGYGKDRPARPGYGAREGGARGPGGPGARAGYGPRDGGARGPGARAGFGPRDGGPRGPGAGRPDFKDKPFRKPGPGRTAGPGGAGRDFGPRGDRPPRPDGGPRGDRPPRPDSGPRARTSSSRPEFGAGPRFPDKGAGFREERPRRFAPKPFEVAPAPGSDIHKPVSPEVKPALPLKTDKGRWKESRFLLEGAKNIADALAASSGIVQAAYVAEGFEDKDLLAAFKKNRVQVIPVTADDIKALSDTETPQGVIAVCNFAALRIDWNTARYITVMDAVQDPGNVGAIFRTSSALGMDAIVLGKGSCDPYNPKVVRSSVGALLGMPFETGEDLGAKITFLRSKGFSVVATSSHAKQTLEQAKLRKKVALIVGNEGAGTGASYQDMADAVVKIPLKSKVESLNVAVAHGILSYQLIHGRAQ